MILFCFRFAEPEVVIMDVEPTVSLSLSSVGVVVVCVAPREKARALSHIWTDEETGDFLSLMQGDETAIGDFNRKDAKDEFEGGGCGCC